MGSNECEDKAQLSLWPYGGPAGNAAWRVLENQKLKPKNAVKNSGTVLYTTGKIEDLFRCVSMLCSSSDTDSPDRSDPALRRAPLQVKLLDDVRVRGHHSRRRLCLSLPPDLRYLYSAAPLAYYLGASVKIGGKPYMAFEADEPLRLPEFPDFETYMGEALRRTFFLDCAVRCAAQSGKNLDGVDVRHIFSGSAGDIFSMGMEERFLLYMEPSLRMPDLPRWHIASYLEPAPESVEVLPFLLGSLSAIYEPRYSDASERDIVSMCVKEFLWHKKAVGPAASDKKRAIVVPSLHEACAHQWFAEGFPVDAVKGSVKAFINKRRFPGTGRGQARIAVVCNEKAMRQEIRVIEEGMPGSSAAVKVHKDISISGFGEVFARGYDVVQFIGHCDSRGFKCSDGFARVSNIEENNTPMFFFNSCSSHMEAALLIDKGSVCGVATLFRVLEEAAMEVCKNFYLMLGAGYSALTSINAAKECSVLGKEYLLIGDGSFSCFDDGLLKPFYRIAGRGGKYSLQCTMDNYDKGYITSIGRSEGNATSDLGFETGPMGAGQLERIGRGLRGYCLYHRNIYRSVEEAALAAMREGL